MGGQRGDLITGLGGAGVCSGTKHHVNPGASVQPGGSLSVSLKETAKPLPSAHCGWVSLLPETDHLICDNRIKDPHEDTAGVEAKFCLYILSSFSSICLHCSPVKWDSWVAPVVGLCTPLLLPSYKDPNSLKATEQLPSSSPPGSPLNHKAIPGETHGCCLRCVSLSLQV